jgi:hypothetical protein
MVEIGQVKCDDENSRQSPPNLAPSEIVGAHVEPQLSVEVFKRKTRRTQKHRTAPVDTRENWARFAFAPPSQGAGKKHSEVVRQTVAII